MTTPPSATSAANGVAEPDGQPYADLQLFRSGLADVPTSAKVPTLALQLERAVRSADPRISGMEACDYEDGTSEAIVATGTGIGRRARRPTPVPVGRRPRHRRQRDADRLLVRHRPGDRRSRRRGLRRRGHPPTTQLLGAAKPATSRITVVLDPFVTAQFLDILGFALSAENVLKGRSLFADRVGEEVVTAGHPHRGPHRRRRHDGHRRRRRGLATRRIPLLYASGRLEDFLHDSYTARRLGTASTGSAVQGFVDAHVGTRALAITPGPTSPTDLVAGIDDGVLSNGVSGLPLRRQPHQRRLLHRRRGLRISGGALGEPVEFTIASTLPADAAGRAGGRVRSHPGCRCRQPASPRHRRRHGLG